MRKETILEGKSIFKSVNNGRNLKTACFKAKILGIMNLNAAKFSLSTECAIRKCQNLNIY